MKISDVNSMCNQAIEKLAQELENGKSEHLKAYLRAMGKFHNYSLANMLLIGFQKPDAKRVAGFHTWKKLGRHVKKGERGIAIMAPVIYNDKKDLITDHGEEEIELEILKSFKTVYVFDISQTEGRPLPEFAKPHGKAGDYLDRIRKYAKLKRISVHYGNIPGTTVGISCGSKIVIQKGLSEAEEFATITHELAHEILHRDTEIPLVDRKTRELEAEAVSYIVCCGIGLDSNNSSSDYIQLYNGDKNTLKTSLRRIQSTAQNILRGIEAMDGKRPKGQAA